MTSDLHIVVDVRDNQTMSRYSVISNGKVTFHNAGTEQLVITPKSAGDEPFCRKDGTKWPNQTVTVKKNNGVRPVFSCDAYLEENGELQYTAKIGNAAAEDPIVILERKMMMQPKPDPIVILERDNIGPDLLIAAAGFLVGATLAGLVVLSRLRSGGPRP